MNFIKLRKKTTFAKLKFLSLSVRKNVEISKYPRALLEICHAIIEEYQAVGNEKIEMKKLSPCRDLNLAFECVNSQNHRREPLPLSHNLSFDDK